MTYAFYRDEWHGTLGEGAFGASLPRALAVVRDRVFPADPAGDPGAYSRAACAAVDVDAAYGGSAAAIASVTTGTVSMSFGDGSSRRADMVRAVDSELAGTPLAFKGLG
ncbi:MAG: hypothetical protein ACLROE_01610 [Collinsella intestinalis]|uniref:hypothetical protein n=1 Tax=Collinsella sp. TaxID=1965294 RepID=UPI002E7631CA|nr:hypothetical protein [Collinsella sp.]MEE0703988.1 hypothetical protein [Collinsella sp.]